MSLMARSTLHSKCFRRAFCRFEPFFVFLTRENWGGCKKVSPSIIVALAPIFGPPKSEKFLDRALWKRLLGSFSPEDLTHDFTLPFCVHTQLKQCQSRFESDDATCETLNDSCKILFLLFRYVQVWMVNYTRTLCVQLMWCDSQKEHYQTFKALSMQ